MFMLKKYEGNRWIVQILDFFEKLLSVMPRDLWSVYIGSRDDQPIAGLLVFYFNGTVEYFTPVIVSEHRNTQALALVIYEAMKDAISRKGCKTGIGAGLG